MTPEPEQIVAIIERRREANADAMQHVLCASGHGMDTVRAKSCARRQLAFLDNLTRDPDLAAHFIVGLSTTPNREDFARYPTRHRRAA